MGNNRTLSIAVVSLDMINTLWDSEICKDEMIRALRITRRALERLKADLELPHRSPRKSWHRPHLSRPRKKHEEVSPEEVQHRVAKVQSTWTDEVFVLRSMGRVRPLPYRVKVVSLGRTR
jgi:hypothetical protein